MRFASTKRFFNAAAWTAPLVVILSTANGCGTSYREDLDYKYTVEQSWTVDELQFGEIQQFESVFWEPDDTVSLRSMIANDSLVSGRRVLEIGTGTGLLAILCQQNGATQVTATDINPAAFACARYNAAMLNSDENLDFLLVPKSSPGAFSTLEQGKKFDIIISNPPWEDGSISKPADHAFYDPGFALMDSLLAGLPDRLTPGGRCLLAYGHVPAIRRLETESARLGYGFKILDDRSLDELEPDFLPGMLVEIRVKVNTSKVVYDETSGASFESESKTSD